MNRKEKIVSILMRNWMYVFLIAVALTTVCGMILYQYLRQDPVVVTVKDAKGYKVSQVVHKRPNETVGQVVDKVVGTNSSYACAHDYNQRIHSLSSLDLTEPISGSVTVDGNTVPFETTSATVGEALNELGIRVSPVDRVFPDTSTLLTKGNSNITIERVNSDSQIRSEILPYATESRANDQLPYNTTNLIQSGKNGFRSYTEEIVYSAGQEVERHVTGEQRIDPVNEIVEVGTNLTIGKPNVEPEDIEGWRPYVVKALEENGLEPTEDRVSRVLRQIITESDGDQNAHQQIVDLNTAIGQEARGLLQTTPATFEYYKHPGYDDILNGYHNLLAAINYAKDVYGDDLVGMGRGIGY